MYGFGIFCFNRSHLGVYAQRVPHFPVEFVGHPIVDRYGGRREKHSSAMTGAIGVGRSSSETPLVVLLPGSRAQELRRHVPLMLSAATALARRAHLRPPRVTLGAR